MTCSTAENDPAQWRTGLANAVLREIVTHLDTLVESGAETAIDLRGLPMTDADRAELEERLGHGEVSAVLTVAGRSEVWETAVSGVWWVRHLGDGGRVAAEEIVVARVPEILATHPDDARDALARLRGMLDDEAAARRATPRTGLQLEEAP